MVDPPLTLLQQAKILVAHNLSLNQELLAIGCTYGPVSYKSKINRPKSGCYFPHMRSSKGYQPRSLNLAWGGGEDGPSEVLMVAEAWDGGEDGPSVVLLVAEAWDGGEDGLSEVFLVP